MAIRVEIAVLAAVAAAVVLVWRWLRRRRLARAGAVEGRDDAIEALDARLGAAAAIAEQFPVAALDERAKALEAQGKYAEAEVFAQRALALREAELGPGESEIADRLCGLARLCVARGGGYDEAHAGRDGRAYGIPPVRPDKLMVLDSLASRAQRK